MASIRLDKHDITHALLVRKRTFPNLVLRVFHPTAPWSERGGGKMKDPGNEVERFHVYCGGLLCDSGIQTSLFK